MLANEVVDAIFMLVQVEATHDPSNDDEEDAYSSGGFCTPEEYQPSPPRHRRRKDQEDPEYDPSGEVYITRFILIKLYAQFDVPKITNTSIVCCIG